MLISGPHFKIDLFHNLGLAAFVAGLSLIVSTTSGKEAVRQQYAKEANLRPKPMCMARFTLNSKY